MSAEPELPDAEGAWRYWNGKEWEMVDVCFGTSGRPFGFSFGGEKMHPCAPMRWRRVLSVDEEDALRAEVARLNEALAGAFTVAPLNWTDKRTYSECYHGSPSVTVSLHADKRTWVAEFRSREAAKLACEAYRAVVEKQHITAALVPAAGSQRP